MTLALPPVCLRSIEAAAAALILLAAVNSGTGSSVRAQDRPAVAVPQKAKPVPPPRVKLKNPPQRQTAPPAPRRPAAGRIPKSPSPSATGPGAPDRRLPRPPSSGPNRIVPPGRLIGDGQPRRPLPPPGQPSGPNLAPPESGPRQPFVGPRRPGLPTLVTIPPARVPPPLSPQPPPLPTGGPDPRLTGVPVDTTQLPDEVLVALPAGEPDTTIEGAAQRLNLTILERADMPLIASRVVRLAIPDTRTVAEVVQALSAEPGIGAAQPNHIYGRQQGGHAAESVPQYALEKISAGAAHALSLGRNVVIAVIDTGVDGSHPDISAATLTSQDLLGASVPHEPAHATAVASILAARGVTRGIAPEARLLSLRAFASFGPIGAPTTARSTTMVVLKAIEAAVKQRSRILNLSFAGPRDALLERILAAAIDQNTIAVAAAGNGGREAAPVYPAAYPGVIAVTATDAADRIYRNANQGEYIAIAAPGVEVLAASADHGHELVSGTSFATAYVSGLAALLLELAPGLTPPEVLRALQETARDLGEPGRDPAFGAGLADAEALLRHPLARRGR